MRGRFAIFAMFVLCACLLPLTTAYSHATSRYFEPTGHNISGVFLGYWQAHGDISQQGYPLTEEFLEVSAADQQTYRVQYFERAVFELHPANQPPHIVLLSLLGSFLYQRKYPVGAPGQQASTANPLYFQQTGKTLGGVFRVYWETYGGLGQQGYPISDEFQEVSPLDNKTYTVQYFERAVFEYHPENTPPHLVLLSQLGRFELERRYPNGSNPAAAPAAPLGPGATPTVFGVVAPTAIATNTQEPAPTSTPEPVPSTALCQPPPSSVYSACAVVDNENPPRRTDVKVTGVLYHNGLPVRDATMNTTWRYRSTASSCDGALTNAYGVAECGKGIGGATAGFTVVIDVRFLDASGGFITGAATSFTPR